MNNELTKNESRMNYELIKSELKELGIHWELTTSYI